MAMAPRPGTLAIELSSRRGSVALRDPGGAVHERAFEPGDRAREPLLPEIDALVRGAGLRPRDLRAIGVSAGPGGFTGLRISIAAAKGIAEAIGAAVVAVPSTLVIAESARREDPEAIDRAASIAVVVASKRGTAWIHRVQADPSSPSGWRDLAPGAAESPETIAHGDAWRDLDGVRIVADEHQDPAVLAALESRGARRWRSRGDSPPIAASACLLLAERLESAGAGTGPEALLPIYPREPEAVTLWNLRHPADAASG